MMDTSELDDFMEFDDVLDPSFFTEEDQEDEEGDESYFEDASQDDVDLED